VLFGGGIKDAGFGVPPEGACRRNGAVEPRHTDGPLGHERDADGGPCQLEQLHQLRGAFFVTGVVRTYGHVPHPPHDAVELGCGSAAPASA
jgi:hypothetical protein